MAESAGLEPANSVDDDYPAEAGRIPGPRHPTGQGARRAMPWYSRYFGRGQTPSSETSVDSVRPTWSWIEPILVLMLGVALGLVTQQAIGTSAFLRVPALIAALILVAHGVTTLSTKHDPDDADEEQASELVVSDSTEVVPVRVQQINASNPGKAIYSAVPAGEAKAGPTATQVRSENQPMYLVMLLSIWLGLATLANPGAPRMLLTLSLLASFMLFSDAYKMLRNQV